MESSSLFACSLVFLAATGVAGAQSLEGVFPPHVTLVGAGVPSDSACADFDWDGRPDVATLSGGTIWISLQVGLARFVPHGSHAASAERRLLAADIDGDGHVDLVTYFDVIQVFLGDGAGGFTAQAPLWTANSTSAWQTAIGLGDFYGDGVLVLAATSVSPGEVRVFRGLGNGSFAAPQVISFQPIDHNPNHIALGDAARHGERYLRGSGVAAEAVRQALARHPGAWEVATWTTAPRALAFWRKTLPACARGELRETEEDHPFGRRIVFRLDTRADDGR